MKKIKRIIIPKAVGLYINLLSYIDANEAKNKAYRLFSHPKKGKLNIDDLPKTLKNSKRVSFDVNGEKLQAYFWEGNEKTILLVHGWESNSSRWKKTLPFLKQTGYTIIAIDAPAHGLSSGKEYTTPKYAAFIDFMVQKFEPQVLIGHSLGGSAVSYYLTHYPNKILEKIVLLGAPSEFKIIRENFNRLLGLNEKVKSLLLKYYAENFPIDFNKFNGHELAENFTQKGFIAHDVKDKIVLIDEGRKYASAWKNAVYIETRNLGHRLHDEELYQKMAEFITMA